MKKIAILGCIMSMALLVGCTTTEANETDSVVVEVESNAEDASLSWEAEGESVENVTEDALVSSEATDGQEDSMVEGTTEAVTEPSESTEPDSAEAPAVEPVTVFPELDYPEDDWRSAGFYVNGNYAKLPMTYDELCALGFDGLCPGNGISDFDLEYYQENQPESLMMPAYSFPVFSYYTAFNSDNEEVTVRFVNTAGEAKTLTDCMVFTMSFATPNYEHQLGYEELPNDVRLCNGISWESTYDDIIAKMGEPSEVTDVTDPGKGFSGTMTYYIEEGNLQRYIQFDMFEGGITGMQLWIMPIDAHKLW